MCAAHDAKMRGQIVEYARPIKGPSARLPPEGRPKYFPEAHLSVKIVIQS